MYNLISSLCDSGSVHLYGFPGISTNSNNLIFFLHSHRTFPKETYSISDSDSERILLCTTLITENGVNIKIYLEQFIL